MGGREAIRGFIYQTIVSVIQSLNNDQWAYVRIEPDTVNDKVDILWEDKDNNIRCQQIKSSVKNFTKPDIDNWLEEIKKDLPEAKVHELVLIGNVSTGTDRYINQLRNNDSIKVELITFNLDFMESKVRDEVSRFLSLHEYHLPHPTIELIAGGLIYQFLGFSVMGSRVSQFEFSEDLLEWVKYNYGKNMGIAQKRDKLSVHFYDQLNRRFVLEIKPESLLDFEPPFLEDQKQKIFLHYTEAAEITLPERTNKENEPGSSQWPKIISLTENSPAEVSTSSKNLIKAVLKECFAIEVGEDYFNVGNLGRRNNFLPAPFNSVEYTGTFEEKGKMKSLNNLRWEIETLVELNKLVQDLKEYVAVSLVVENAGSSFDEELSVSLTIPRTVQIAIPENIYIPENIEAIDLLIDSRFIKQLFKIKEDSLVSEFEYGPWVNFDPTGAMEAFYKTSGTAKQLEFKKDQFKRQLESIFEFEFFSDVPDFHLLRFHFKKINPNIKMTFPFRLFLKSQVDFEIGYEIKTKNGSKIHQGKLRCLCGELMEEMTKII